MAQSSKPKDVLAFIQSERERIFLELGQLVAFKSVHSDLTQGPDLVAATPWGTTVDIEIDDVNQGFATDPSQPALVSLTCLRQTSRTNWHGRYQPIDGSAANCSP